MNSYGNKNNKKVLVIILIVLFLIIGLAVSVLAMTVTGNIALNNKQKLTKGIKDTVVKLNEMYPENETNFIQDYNKMYATPFEQETTITANIAQVNMGEMEGNEEAEQLINVLKEFVTETKITNYVQSDLKNNIIKENLKLTVGDAVEEISLDVEYNNDTIGFRCKELNEKYLYVSKDDIQSNIQYEEYMEIFKILGKLGNNPNIEVLKFTEEEKLYFKNNYSEILNKYLTEENITETKSAIVVDGEVKKCSAVTLSFYKQKIQAIVGEILQKFENDAIGKNIVVNKIAVLVEEFTEETLLELVKEIRGGLVNLENDTKIGITIYCTSFKTYAVNIELYEDGKSNNVRLILGKDIINLELTENETKIATGTIANNNVDIIINEDDETVTMNLKDQGNITEVMINGTAEDYNNSIIFRHEEITNTDIENKERYSIRYVINTEDGGADFTINVDVKSKHIDSISTTEFTDENSLSLITGNTTDLQDYITKVTTNGMAILQNAQEKSAFIKQILTIIGLNQNIIDDTEESLEQSDTVLDEQEVQSFNTLFDVYKGTQKGSEIKSLLDIIGNNNQDSEHVVTVIIVGPDNSIIINTNNSLEMAIAKDDIVNTGEYIMAIAQYDEEGYIKTIAIKKNF